MICALRRWLRVNDEVSEEPEAGLAGSRCTLRFPQQFRHLLPRLARSRAVVRLNPEALRFGDDVISSRESNARIGTVGFLRAAFKNVAMKDHDNTEQRRIGSDHRRGFLGEISQILESDVGHGGGSINKS
jgi:hypothetical protein